MPSLFLDPNHPDKEDDAHMRKMDEKVGIKFFWGGGEGRKEERCARGEMFGGRMDGWKGASEGSRAVLLIPLQPRFFYLSPLESPLTNLLSPDPLRFCNSVPSVQEQAAKVERYKTLLAPFILRRLKSEVATQLIAKKHVVEVRGRRGDGGRMWV